MCLEAVWKMLTAFFVEEGVCHSYVVASCLPEGEVWSVKIQICSVKVEAGSCIEAKKARPALSREADCDYCDLSAVEAW